MFRLSDIAVATALLTRAPIPVPPEIAGARAAKAAWAYPLVGAGLGLAAGLVFLLLAMAGLAPGVTAALTLAALVYASGALHEDGLADSADGLGGGRDRAHALDIMRDSRLGAYGGCALSLAFLARWSAIAALAPSEAMIVLATAGAASRAAMAGVMTALPPARTDGLSSAVGRPPRASALIAVILAALVALSCGPAGIVALAAAGGGAVLVAAIAHRKIGGQTGDVLGAAQQAAEIAALATLSI